MSPGMYTLLQVALSVGGTWRHICCGGLSFVTSFCHVPSTDTGPKQVSYFTVIIFDFLQYYL